MFKTNKKAFTMIELLVCLICLGVLSIGIATFAAAIKGNISLIDDRDKQVSEEYQDVLKLKLDGINAINELSYEDNLYRAERLPVNNSFDMSLYYVPGALEKVEYKSSNTNVLVINGNSFQTRQPGIAYIEIRIFELKNDGAYHDVDRIKYVPVITYSTAESPLITELNYYFYGGEHYHCWINVED